ncbi:MAG: carboxypeptidase-like regulatory domain-containing protein [Flavobacteriales bacterium]
MNIRHISLFIALLLLFGCNKGAGTFTLEGVITDASFNQPLAGATVELYGLGSSSNQYTMVASAVTGADGKYTFSFDRTRTEKYTLFVKKPLYFEQEIDVYYSQLKLKETNIRNVTTSAQSWVEIRIFNNNAANNDHLQFIRQQGKSGCAACCIGDFTHLYGAQDTSIFCINDGNALYSIEYAVFGTSNTGILGVTTVPFDTTVLNLTY